MRVQQNKIELLAPAGNLEKLETAFYFGADAVYLGGKKFGLRAQADNFDDEGLKAAVDFAHAAGKKVYVTVNIFAKNNDFSELFDYLQLLDGIGADAVIASDIGVISFIRQNFPGLCLHISTQANTLNLHAAKFYADIGAKRIVLARELSIKEICEIRDALPADTELEAFVHGAMCISYSGRCLLSNYLTSRDSNRGECVQACRWEYTITEKSRPNQYFEIQEDARGTYILNSKDLNMIEHIDKLYNAGITSFKIEGRVKTAYYAATTTNAYRRAIDSFYKNGLKNYSLPDNLKNELSKTSHRRFTTGFYISDPERECLETSMPVQDYEFVAIVLGYDEENQRARIQMRNRFKSGDTLQVLSPTDTFNQEIVVKKLTDTDGQAVADALKVQQELYLYTDVRLCKGDILRAAIKKSTGTNGF